MGVSGVQARGTDGGVGREWENLVNRYRRVGGQQGTLAQGEVLEVCLIFLSKEFSHTDVVEACCTVLEKIDLL